MHQCLLYHSGQLAGSYTFLEATHPGEGTLGAQVLAIVGFFPRNILFSGLLSGEKKKYINGALGCISFQLTNIDPLPLIF